MHSLSINKSNGARTIAVLGAGPAGLAAAWKLAKNGEQVVLLEKAPRVGGFGGSFQWKDHVLDYGPHLFHVKDTEATYAVRSLFQDGSSSEHPDLLSGKRNIYVLLKGRYFHYPHRFYEVISKLNPLLSVRMIIDFLISSFLYKFIAVPDDSFESWGIKRFGKTLYNLCFGEYTEKVWGISAREISPKFASQKLRGLNMRAVISKLLGGRGEEQQSYWMDFLYPRKGSGDLYERIAKEFIDSGGRLHLNAEVVRLERENRKFSQVIFRQEGQEKVLGCDYIISAIPVPQVITMIQPPLGDYAAYKAHRLRYRSLVLLYLELEQERVRDAHWIYLASQRFLFNRITEQKNISPETIARAKTVLVLELTCAYDDERWHLPDEEIYSMALEDIEKLPQIDASKITDYKVLRLWDAYPIYDLAFDKNLAVLIDTLLGFENLISTGRQGLFLQNDMHDSMMLGFSAADFLSNELNSHYHRRKWYQKSVPFLSL